MDLWFVRHGESTSNAGLKTESPGATPLTEKGHEQAKDFAARFPMTPKVVYASPFIRTQETAAPLCARYGLTPVIVPIQEWTFLDPAQYSGTTIHDRRPAVLDYMERAKPDTVDGPGAESFLMLMGRVQTFLTLASLLPEGPIVAFSHERFMKAVLWSFRFGLPLDGEALRRYWGFSNQLDVPNTGVVRMHLTRRWGLVD